MSGAGESASAWALLRQPAFARYFVGNALSNTGTWVQDIAAAVILYELTGSALFVAVLALCSHGVSLVLAPVGGQLADRLDRRLLLIVVHVCQAVAALALALLTALGDASAAGIVIVALVLGIGRALNTPALLAFLPSLVSERDLAQATALQSVTFNLARVVGPIVGVALTTSVGPAAAFAANGASFLAFAVLLLSLGAVKRSPRRGGGSFLAGLSYVRAHPRLAVILLCCIVIGMSTDPVVTLGPALSDAFGQDASGAGLCVSAFGVGAVLSAPFAGGIRRRIGRGNTSIACLIAIAVLFGGVAVSPSWHVVLGAFALAGAAYLIGNADLTTLVQESVVDEVRGRVMALWSMAFIGSRPLAAALDGALADAVSAQTAVGVLGGVVLVVACAAGVTLRRGER
mgnify:CR=1 FL=1